MRYTQLYVILAHVNEQYDVYFSQAVSREEAIRAVEARGKTVEWAKLFTTIAYDNLCNPNRVRRKRASVSRNEDLASGAGEDTDNGPAVENLGARPRKRIRRS